MDVLICILTIDLFLFSSKFLTFASQKVKNIGEGCNRNKLEELVGNGTVEYDMGQFFYVD